MTHELTKTSVPLDSDLADVATSLSDDCSQITCTLRDKKGREVTFCTDLPTGPHVRAIRQTIEITRAPRSDGTRTATLTVMTKHPQFRMKN